MEINLRFPPCSALPRAPPAFGIGSPAPCLFFWCPRFPCVGEDSTASNNNSNNRQCWTTAFCIGAGTVAWSHSTIASRQQTIRLLSVDALEPSLWLCLGPQAYRKQKREVPDGDLRFRRTLNLSRNKYKLSWLVQKVASAIFTQKMTNSCCFDECIDSLWLLPFLQHSYKTANEGYTVDHRDVAMQHSNFMIARLQISQTLHNRRQWPKPFKALHKKASKQIYAQTTHNLLPSRHLGQ